MKQNRVLWFALSVITACPATAVIAHASRTVVRENVGAMISVLPFDTKQTYDSKCASCHGKDGRGKTVKGRLSHARNLTDASWQNDVSDERLFNSISNGKGKMPTFKKKLTENQIDELVGYVRQFKR